MLEILKRLKPFLIITKYNVSSRALNCWIKKNLFDDFDEYFHKDV